MKKIMSIVMALVLLCAMVCTVSAAQDDFVPSISYKDAPLVVPVKDGQGNNAYGRIIGANGQVIDYFYEDCLLITPVSQVEQSEKIPEDAAALLLDVYKKLVDGSMKLPYEKVAGYKGENMVIRELVDATWMCAELGDAVDHEALVEPEGVVFELTFDLGVAAGTNVVVMTYKENQWAPIVSTKNNGDGTVTCTFEKLCPVVFAVPTSTTPPSHTGDNSNLVLWGVLMGVSAVVLVALVVVASRKRKEA